MDVWNVWFWLWFAPLGKRHVVVFCFVALGGSMMNGRACGGCCGFGGVSDTLSPVRRWRRRMRVVFFSQGTNKVVG